MVPAALQKCTALVVLDDVAERRFVAMLLRSMGFGETNHLESYEKARDAVIASSYDLVLTDWSVQDMPMPDFLQTIRNFPTTERSAIPFILFTARAGASDVNKARQLGIDGYLIKPISRGIFSERVAAVLSAKRPFIRSVNYVGPCRRRLIDFSYSGPMRRVSDPTESVFSESIDAADRARIISTLSLVQNAAQNIAPGDRNSMRLLFNAVSELKIVALSVNDLIAAEIAGHMNRYIEAVGATQLLSRDVVLTNCEALRHVVHTPLGMRDARSRIATDVERMINKKIRQAAEVSLPRAV